MSIWGEGTLVVVPAYNEESALGDVLDDVRQLCGNIDILVVDDGSLDRTVDIAKSRNVKLLSLPVNLGVGGAMRAGFKYARARGYQSVVQLDADGQHDPARVRDLVAQLDTYDVVIGARFAGTGHYEVSGPRKWAMVVFAKLIGRIAKSPLTDVTSGFKAIGPHAIELYAREYPAEYLGDTLEALVIAAKSGLKIGQVPVAMRERQGGEPSQSPVRAARYLVRATVALSIALLRPASKKYPQQRPAVQAEARAE